MNKTFERTLFIALAVIGIMLTLQINGALGAEATTPIRCKYAAGTLGYVVLPNGVVNFTLAEDLTITVLEEISLDPPADDPNQSKLYFYRFSAEYDQPKIACEVHGHHIFDEYKKLMPKQSYSLFFFPKEDAISCR